VTQDLSFMEEKIYLPYLLSNNTMWQYEGKETKKLSISDILADQYSNIKNLKVSSHEHRIILTFRVPSRYTAEIKGNRRQNFKVEVGDRSAQRDRVSHQPPNF